MGSARPKIDLRPAVTPKHPDDAAKRNAGDAEQTTARAVRNGRYLDWFVFFVADVQTGFGAFVAVFLTTQKWTQVDIGLVLTVSGLVALVSQIPLGAAVDAAKSIRSLALMSLLAIGVSAFSFTAWPIFPVVMATRVLHAIASCLLGLALVSISISLTDADQVSQRLGRNAAFASAGTGIAAAVMGACGYYFFNGSVFILAGALVFPAMFALSQIDSRDLGAGALRRVSDQASDQRAGPKAFAAGFGEVLRQRTLLIFVACVIMFHLANAAMLPLAASMLTLRSGQAATAMVAAAIVIPQFTVTVLSVWVGQKARIYGRKPLLLLGFLTLLLRGFLFSVTGNPYLLVLFQVLDGVSAACLGVLVPLTIVDLTRERGHFNLVQGTVGCAMGIGAAISTTLSGYVSDQFGSFAAFNLMTALAALGVLCLAFAMPETRPAGESAGRRVQKD